MGSSPSINSIMNMTQHLKNSLSLLRLPNTLHTPSYISPLSSTAKTMTATASSSSTAVAAVVSPSSYLTPRTGGGGCCGGKRVGTPNTLFTVSCGCNSNTYGGEAKLIII